MSVLNQTKSKMEAAIEHLKKELQSIRTGRANPAMLEHVLVEVYGSPMRIKDIASINTPEPRQLLIRPFDKGNCAAIGKAIQKELGFNPTVDADQVRINIPPMNTELRNDMIKLCHKRQEEAKVGIRNVRRDANEGIKKQQSSGEMAEDERKKLEKQIQELTDNFCREADDIVKKKETEISTI